jgi:hypothetical protein
MMALILIIGTIFALLGAMALMGLMGCDSTTGTGGAGNGSGSGSGNGSGDLAPQFPEGSGQQANSTRPYPEGPFGVGKGSIIENYKFIGYPNAMKVNNALAEIEMAEFYNPTSDGVYGEGSAFPADALKPKVILIDVASVWCGPCNQEAATVLPGLHAKYAPQGGEFFLQLFDGPKPGIAATSKSLYNWTTKYKVDYPSAIDPSGKLEALFQSNAFPTNMIIRTKDMKIMNVVAGAPEAGSSFWLTYEKIMKGQL